MWFTVSCVGYTEILRFVYHKFKRMHLAGYQMQSINQSSAGNKSTLGTDNKAIHHGIRLSSLHSSSHSMNNHLSRQLEVLLERRRPRPFTLAFFW